MTQHLKPGGKINVLGSTRLFIVKQVITREAIERPETSVLKARARDKKWRDKNRKRKRERERSPHYRAQRRAREKENPAAVKRAEQRRSINKNHRPFVSIDIEGMDIPGQDIVKTTVEPNAEGIAAAYKNIYPKHAPILLAAQGWQRTHSATALSDNPSLSRTEGVDTECNWLGTDDKRPLTSLEMLEFLTNLPAKFGLAQGYADGVLFVSYSFSYDATQILKDLPYKKAWEITRRKKFGTKKKLRSPVLVGEYAIDYLKGKHLRIWKLRDPDIPYKLVCNKDGVPLYDSRTGRVIQKLDHVAYINIQDVFGFYQAPFVTAMQSLVGLGYLSQDDYDTIKRNKAERGKFDEKPFADIKRYCQLELTTLAKGMTVLRDGVDAMGLPALQYWTGPGAMAAALIKKHKLKEEHYSPDIVTDNLSLQQERAHHAFVGGRIELLKQGCALNLSLWEYDIASAYPDAMWKLPSMKGGTWVHHDKDAKYNSVIGYTTGKANMLSMFKVRWKFPEVATDGWPIPFFPFPYRVRKRGLILCPSQGVAWIMRDEVLAACSWVKRFFPHTKETEYSKYFTIEEWSEFVPGNAVLPYAFVRELYELRWKIKREINRTGVYNILEKVIKLAINSLYGKTAQGVRGGGDDDKPPSCVNPYYAAAITAHVRARLLQAALQDPAAIVSFMTDGIISTRELTRLPRVKAEGEETDLGDWEMKRHEGGFFFIPGLYAVGTGETIKTRRRGLRAATITVPKPDTKDGGYDFVLDKTVREFLTQDVLQAWLSAPTPTTETGEPALIPPRLLYRLRAYVTVGEACASEDRYELRGRWCKELRRLNADSPGAKRDFGGLPHEFFYTEPPHMRSRRKTCSLLKLLKRMCAGMSAKDAMAMLCEMLFAKPADIEAALRSGEALRTRFLIPTTPVGNPTPNKLSAPAKPEWLALGSLEEDERESLFDNKDRDTADIGMGMS